MYPCSAFDNSTLDHAIYSICISNIKPACRTHFSLSKAKGGDLNLQWHRQCFNVYCYFNKKKQHSGVGQVQ